MSDPMNEQEKDRLLVRLDYLKELASVQAGQFEKGILEVADIAEKLGIHPDTVKHIRGLASVVADIKDGFANVIAIIKNLKGGSNDSH